MTTKRMAMTHLTELMGEIKETADWRGHGNFTTEIFDDTHARITCAKCLLDADANTNPMPNEIDIGGPLVALNCRTREEQDG